MRYPISPTEVLRNVPSKVNSGVIEKINQQASSNVFRLSNKYTMASINMKFSEYDKTKIRLIYKNAGWSEVEIEDRIEELGYTPHLSQGVNKTVIGIVGDLNREELIDSLGAYPQIEKLVEDINYLRFKLHDIKSERGNDVENEGLNNNTEYTFEDIKGQSEKLKKVFDFRGRQSSYYREASEILDLITHEKKGNKFIYKLTEIGENYISLRPDKRSELLAQQILKLPVMNYIFELLVKKTTESLGEKGEVTKKEITEIISRLIDAIREDNDFSNILIDFTTLIFKITGRGSYLVEKREEFKSWAKYLKAEVLPLPASPTITPIPLVFFK